MRREKKLKIAAYQFEITKDIRRNLSVIKNAIITAKSQDVNLIIFPECCLTGYPPRNIESSHDVDFDKVYLACDEVQRLVNELDICVIIGAIYKEQNHIFNRAICLKPNQESLNYDKRALYGWDKDNFETGMEKGIFEIQGIKFGVRICFEIRFPEYFRELYKEGTDINIVLFYDVSDSENAERYNMIKGHLQTRAVENVTTTISVNTILPFQTAPTAVFDKSGVICRECNPGKEAMLIYEYVKTEDDFGENGRRIISNHLVTDNIIS